MKKIIALVLALAMVALCGAALAASITIEKTNEGQVYEIYKLFDAVVDADRVDGGDGISYKLRSGVNNFKATVDGAEVDGATSWFELDSAGNVTAKSGLNETVLKSDAFKAWAKAYGEKLTDKRVTGNGEDQKITGLDDGYYFITTTTGTLVTIDSIGPDEKVQDKNPPTDIDKEITNVADGDVTSDKEKALAQVGTVVDFEATIPIANGAINYIFEDLMSAGLTLGDTVTVKLLDGENLSEAIAASTYAAEAQGNPKFSNETAADKLDIRIVFDNAWLKANVGKTIVINYTGTVNDSAVIADAANPNKATIKWGNVDNPLTDEDTVEVWSAKITVKKVDGANKPLEGAGFKLFKTVDDNGTEKKLYYAYAASTGVSWVENVDNATEIFPKRTHTNEGAEDDVVSGDAIGVFKGLANGTYTLTESTVPAGYNKAADVSLTIKDADAQDLDLSVETTVQNNQGAELPSTGGIGTTIFYIIGGVLLIGAAVILVARRKAHD